MKKALLGTIVAFVAVMAPAISHAATYEYVNIQGALEMVTANTADQALAIPTDMDPHSGVMLVTPAPVTVTTVTPVPPVVVVTTTTTNTSPVVTPTATVGTYTGQIATGVNNGSVGGAPQSATLVLNSDGTASLMTTYQNGQPSITENGTWTMANTQVQVTLSGNGTQNYSAPHILVFSQNGNTLTTSQWNSSYYGGAGFTVTKSN